MAVVRDFFGMSHGELLEFIRTQVKFNQAVLLYLHNGENDEEYTPEQEEADE